MLSVNPKIVALAVVLALAGTVTALRAKIAVKVEADKDFNFTTVRTWGWNPQGAGDVIMARTPDDDPAAMKARAEPVILDAVATNMTARGLTRADTAPDLTVSYYLLLSTSQSAQTMGQFLPGETAWGLPPFATATQSMKVMNQGSLVLDLSAKGVVVWRGVAQTKIDFGIDQKKREAILREGIKELLERYPPKQKK